MITTTNCPQCGNEVQSNLYGLSFAICDCGWTSRKVAPSGIKPASGEMKTVMQLVGAGLSFMFLFIYVMSWGTHVVSATLLNSQRLVGAMSKSGFMELAGICSELGKVECAQESLVSAYRISKDPEPLAELARYQTRLGNKESALKTLSAYFKANGQDGKSALAYAKLLEEAGRTEAAMTYYKASIERRPKILSIDATSGIVRILMGQGRYEEAHKVIDDFHKSAGNASGHLTAELDVIKKQLRTGGRSPSSQPQG